VQYSWIEQDHPELFERIRTAVAEGGWVPVGGMWVEADMNLPSGESIVRQLVHGQRYFESRFGVRCEEVWIPDVFGYPGSLPQIFTGAGCRRFVTQKLSWNKQNRMPHHSFWWEGIDGSRVLAHFPPVDTYNAEIRPNELAHAVANFADHYWSDHSLMPFGYGTGGGGPSEEMMERIDRLGDLEGMPRVAVESPSEFFEHLEAEAATAPVPVWRGELYFETHRGTLTSQVRTKVMNRRCETALRAAELWLATAGDDSHSEVLDGLWKKLLVHQFHDILPGSSIGWVHDEAEADMKAVLNAADGLIASTLCGLGEGLLVGNAATHDRDEIISVDYDLLDEFGDGDPSAGDDRQMLSSSEVAMRVRVPGLGVAPLDALPPPEPVRASLGSLSNGLVELSFGHYGELVSLRDCVRDRELIPPGCVGARFLLAPDHPVEFDAWDLEQWTGRLAEPLGPPDTIGLVDSGPLVGAVRTTWQFGRGTILTKDFVLYAGSPRLDVRVAVEWQEDERLLLLELPLDLNTDSAACEIQFGLQNRPTHTNTSWDDAKFEVCAHRFVDLCEGDFGVAVLNDGRYGHSLQPGPDTPPGTSRVRVSLLRAPRFPDPKADHGLHHVTISVLPHGPGRSEVLAEADSLNTPLVVVPAEGGAPTPPLVRVEDHQVQVSAVKLADDGSGELILRLWEATGNHVEAGIHIEGARREAVRCNLLEEQVPGAEAMELQDGRVSLSLTPFELVTLRIR
jgi:alpha-mannosidase